MRRFFLLLGVLLIVVSSLVAGIRFWGLRATVAEKPAAQAPPAAKDAYPAEDPIAAEIDPLGANAACYVCHMTFVKEELSKVHLHEKIGCIECHGLSAEHANDENIGATKPDIAFKRGEVDASCVKCHEGHDAPATEVVARFLERRLPEKPPPICTDCHGAHRIEEAAESSPGLSEKR